MDFACGCFFGLLAYFLDKSKQIVLVLTALVYWLVEHTASEFIQHCKQIRIIDYVHLIYIYIYIYINLRRSRDGSRLFVWVGGSVCVCVRSSLHSVRFGQLLRCAHKCIVISVIRRQCSVHKARAESTSKMCMFDKRRFDHNLLLFTPFPTV